MLTGGPLTDYVPELLATSHSGEGLFKCHGEILYVQLSLTVSMTTRKTSSTDEDCEIQLNGKTLISAL